MIRDNFDATAFRLKQFGKRGTHVLLNESMCTNMHMRVQAEHMQVSVIVKFK